MECDPSPFAGYAYLSSEIAPLEGSIKEVAEDFLVEEIPAYRPCGSGSHLYFELEKRGLSTRAAIQRIARALGRRPAEFGYAGLKDARAITRQVISIEHEDSARLQGLELDGLRIGWIAHHTNKLKIGHLRGNRFEILVRGVAGEDLARAREVLSLLEREGVPNYYGHQRFGREGTGHLLGRDLVRGDHGAFLERFLAECGSDVLEQVRTGSYRAALERLAAHCADARVALRALAAGAEPAQAVARIPRGLRQLLVSAYQSHLFNLVLSRRMPRIATLQRGDLAFRHDNGACFLVEDPAAEQGRAQRLEISPTGPIYGYKMLCPQGEAGAVEAEILAREGLELRSFARIGKGLDQGGARRPLRIPLRELRVSADPLGVRIAFALPKGAYATTVLEEIFKSRGAAVGKSSQGPPRSVGR